MIWDNKKTVVLNTLKGEECKCPPNLQWIKRGVEGALALNKLGLAAIVSSKFINELKGIDHGLQLKTVE